MKISFLPSGDFTTASSRIRVYSLIKALPGCGVVPSIGPSDDADVLFVQKRVDANVLTLARRFKKRGSLIVYDCDDLGPALYHSAPITTIREMIGLADVVTTNTAGFRDAFISEFGARNVEIVPDPIDYFATRPIDGLADHDGPLRILWFGNRGNIHLLLRYMEVLRKIGDCNIVVCTDPVLRFDLFTTPPFIFAPWNLDDFPQLLRSCHLTFLPHDGLPEDRVKSANRMITSIGWGVPAIVSRTPEYEKLSVNLGVPDAVVDSACHLASVIEHHRPIIVRRQYIQRTQPVIWAKHSAHVVASLLLQVLLKHTSRKARVTHTKTNDVLTQRPTA